MISSTGAGGNDSWCRPASAPTSPRCHGWSPGWSRGSRAYTLAAILHDWLVTEGIRKGAVSARQGDGIFRRVMRESGVPVLRRWLMWAGVRWGALADERRRPGWLVSAPGVLAISVLAAPLVLPPAVVIAPGLLVYGVAEWLASLIWPTRTEELVLPVPARGRTPRELRRPGGRLRLSFVRS